MQTFQNDQSAYLNLQHEPQVVSRGKCPRSPPPLFKIDSLIMWHLYLPNPVFLSKIERLEVSHRHEGLQSISLSDQKKGKVNTDRSRYLEKMCLRVKMCDCLGRIE